MPQDTAGTPASQIRLVLADVDGTLVTKDKILTPRAIRAVERLRERGILFTITSGRPPKGMKMVIDPLRISEPIAGFNGGMMVRPDYTVIEARTLPADTARRVIGIIRDHKADPWVYNGNDWIVSNDQAPHVAREQWTVKFPPVVGNVEAKLDQVVKVTGVSDDLDLMKRLEHDLQQALGDAASAALSQPYYVDVTNKDANKGGVVMALERLLGIPASQMVTLGDQPNDVLMFRKSGMSIAMGQASPEVQKQATHVSTSCEDEGFANGIEKFVLGDA
ncbi:Cof-type HAD-IIB family hydrolase [Komagataeibacter rhaeticus]|uniref:Cof-type HAD-IIB family hydrolase n=1 Tax=Komagataeibacter rhaeticus TaxID=215221 RepID=A0A181C6Z5_9PROT|nr:Cof-type HAD-IIB family hydrolase [Komagataeibacter rhaeticus]ATU74471.1 Cof-type HAD-IIB family hydrolase [Komagataeibacter xylinus]QIP34321.1 Cof-type HAD-IIB family hydrolase [Komagataeibacter rhaeticus]QOC46831.1 Cof-type HAD-IIB family hydrolase [Komagataeibacter rhaeticus]WPP20788.1 Cof-type HAD-IIB family hydrolase [Komagataeibacter rhaeticus]SAY47341.1 Sugar phosphatase YidA [Komagataeibacter rhaeticus]